MKISFNVTGAERKSLVGAISEKLNAPTKYLGAPTFAYKVGDCHIDKVGTVTTEGSVADEQNHALITFLNERGFIGTVEDRGDDDAEPIDADTTVEPEPPYFPEQPHEDWENCAEDFREIDGLPPKMTAPETITIERPATNVKPEILTALLNSKATLIEAALGEDCAWEREYGTDGLPLCDLPIEFSDGKIKFEWLKFGADSDAVTAWSAFLAAACKFSKTAKRVTAKDGEVENQKFAFRTFMVKLEMNDVENKWHRRYLLRNLKGDSAFATPESKAKWQTKHVTKKIIAEEVESNETAE